MPVFEITSPDGRKWDVTAPAGASQEQVLAYARSQWQEAPKDKALAEDPGFFGTLPIAAGRTVDRVMDGLTQLYLGARGEDKALSGLKANVEGKDETYKPLAEARPWATGIGEALPAMAVPMGAGASLVGTAGRMAAAGALPGALEYGSAEDRGKRALIGGAAAAALPVAGAALKTGKALVEPLYEGGRKAIVGRTLNRVAGDNAPAVAGRLANASPVVPGSLPTAAEVAESGGIAALQRSASAANPEAYTQRAMEQSSARLNALRGIAGTEADLARATAVRKAATDPLYAAADMGVAPIDGTFKGLAMRPQFKTAIARAEQLAKDEGLADIFFRGSKGEPVALIGQGAHYIKKALDEAAEHGSSTYTGNAGAKAARKTNQAFQTWLEKSVPEYSQAKQAFAKASEPVNQMQIGQELLGKLETPLGDYGALGTETAAQFARAMRNGDQTAAKATGFPVATLESVMAPQQMRALQGVGEDLARKANAQNLGRGVGSDTFQKLAMQNIAEQSGMPRLAGGLLDLPVVSRGAKWVYKDSDEKLQKLMAEVLLDPQKAAKTMTAAERKLLAQYPAARELLEQTALRGGGLLGLSAAQPLLQP